MGVGIDIGSKTIKLVELSKGGKGFNLKASGAAGYVGSPPENAKDDKSLVPVAEAMKKLKKEAKISSKDVAVSLPESFVYTRTIKFPMLTDSEVASAVTWEAEQYIPIPINEAVIQHQIIERKENTNPAQVVVLLIAAPKVIVSNYARAIEMAGMNLHVVETELMSMVRSLAPDDQTVLIVDIGAKSTDIAVSKKGQLYFSRSIPTAGDAFTRAVSQGLGIKPIQAEEYKKTYGMSGKQLEGKVRASLESVFRVVVDEIKKAMHYYQSEEKSDSPTSVILTGGSAAMPEVASILTKLLGMEVVVGNPFAKVYVAPEVVKSLVGYAPLYSVATGLAMRDA